MLHRLYAAVLRLAASPRAELWLALVSFAESSFFPIPPDTLLLPMVLARPERAWRFAAICTVASVAGGSLGYFIGLEAFSLIAPLVHAYGYDRQLETLRQGFVENGAWIILAKGVTPIPYKLITISAGLAGYAFLPFLGLSLITRGVRFFAEAGLLKVYGEPVRRFIETRLTLVFTISLVGIIAGFVLLKFL